MKHSLRSYRRYPATALLIALSACLAASADDGDAKVSIHPRAARQGEADRKQLNSIRVAVNVVLVPVLVTDPYDRPVRGLTKDAFKLFEDGVEQEVKTFFSQERPVSIGILFDSSTSMNHKMVECRQAIARFLALSIPGDEFFLTKFADRPEKLLPFTQDIDEIERTVASIKPLGWTAMFDAIYLGMNEMRRARYDRKALLILSDGGDNNSRYNEQEIKSLVQEGDVRLFAISVQDRSTALEKLAEESGGRAFRVKKLDELADIAAKVSLELHSEYVLGYTPSVQALDGKYRKVKVQLVQDPPAALRASWRRGYYGPAE